MQVVDDRRQVDGVALHDQPGEAELVGPGRDGRPAIGVQEPAHIGLDIGKGPTLGCAEGHGPATRRQHVEADLQGDGSRRQGEEGVEVGSSSLAAAEDRVEEAHRLALAQLGRDARKLLEPLLE